MPVQKKIASTNRKQIAHLELQIFLTIAHLISRVHTIHEVRNSQSRRWENEQEQARVETSNNNNRSSNATHTNLWKCMMMMMMMIMMHVWALFLTITTKLPSLIVCRLNDFQWEFQLTLTIIRKHHLPPVISQSQHSNTESPNGDVFFVLSCTNRSTCEHRRGKAESVVERSLARRVQLCRSAPSWS